MPFPYSFHGTLRLPDGMSAQRFLSLVAFKLRRRGAGEIDHADARVTFEVEYLQNGQVGPLFLVDAGRVEVSAGNGVAIVAYDISTQRTALVLAAGSVGVFVIGGHYLGGVPLTVAATIAVVGWLFLFGVAYAASRATWRDFLAAIIREIAAAAT
jgi:hypothetical protein